MNLNDIIKQGDVVKIGTRMFKVCNPNSCSTCPIKDACIDKERVLDQKEQLTALYQVRDQVNYFSYAQIQSYL